jgi:hypothetical protein
MATMLANKLPVWYITVYSSLAVVTNFKHFNDVYMVESGDSVARSNSSSSTVVI